MAGCTERDQVQLGIVPAVAAKFLASTGIKSPRKAKWPELAEGS